MDLKEDLEQQQPDLQLKVQFEEGSDLELEHNLEFKEDSYLKGSSELKYSNELVEDSNPKGSSELKYSSEIKEDSDLKGTSELREDSDLKGSSELKYRSELMEDSDLKGSSEHKYSSEMTEDSDLKDDSTLTDNFTLEHQRELDDDSELDHDPELAQVVDEAAKAKPAVPDELHSSDGDSDSDSEEEEPRLKYERVRGDLATLLERDSLTAITSDDKLVVVGTMGGSVVVLDHLGYRQQHRRPHGAPVVTVALSGGYIASAGKDRRVVVQGMMSSEHNTVVVLESCAAVCVLLDPRFGHTRTTTRFVVGHTSGLTLHERSLFSGYRSVGLSDSAGGSIGAAIGLQGGAVRGSAWRGALLAWATDTTVRVYHLGLRTTIALVQRDHSAALDAVQFPPSLHWQTDDTLLVGWADSVKICRVKPRPKETNTRPVSRTSPQVVDANPAPSSSRRSSTASLFATRRASTSPSSAAITDGVPAPLPVPRSAKATPPVALLSSLSSRQLHSSSPTPGLDVSLMLSSSIIGVTGGYSRTTTPPPPDLPPLFVEIECLFQTPFFLCGLSMLDDKLLLALTYSKTPGLEGSRSSPTDTKGPQNFTDDPFEWRRPQLRILEPQQRSYEEVSKDILGTNRYKDYLPLHYKLESVVGGDRWYVLSPRDLVVARLREPQDSLLWLLQHHKYPQALQLLEREGGSLGDHTEASVGREYLNHLIDCHMYEQAATISKRVLGESASEWIELVRRFGEASELSVLHCHLPYGSPPPLPLSVYAEVLTDLLDNNRQGLVKVLQTWPSACYDVDKLVSDVLQRVATHHWSVPLLQALAHLYSHQQRHDKALAIYIKLQHKDIFALIRKHNLYSNISHYADHLMSLDANLTVELCMSHVKEVPPNEMVPALAGQDGFLFAYLSGLYESHRDLCQDYHDDLVQLMADNQQKERLLRFLKTSTNYDLSKALQVCKSRGLLQHTVYLLDRTGNTQDALSLVLLEAKDLEWAIQLCKDHNDGHLWDTLIDHTAHHAENVLPLLLHAGKFVGEATILRKMPPGLQVPGIMSAIADAMGATKKKHALHSGCERLCKRDIVLLTRRRRGQATRGIAVNDDLLCPTCQQHVTGRGARGGLVAFRCDHVYHQHCLSPPPVGSRKEETLALASIRKKRRNKPQPTLVCAVCQLENKLFG